VRRKPELALLDAACADARRNILLFHAPGGTGKTALLKHWLGQLQEKNWNGFERVFGWSFYSQGTGEERQASSEKFIHEALGWFGDENPEVGTALDKAARLVRLIQQQKTLLVLDGIEPLQQQAAPLGKLRDAGLQRLLNDLAVQNAGLVVASSRFEIPELKWPGVAQESVEAFTPDDGAELLHQLQVVGTTDELKQAAQEFDGHGLALVLLASWLKTLHGGDVRCRQEVALLEAADVEYFGGHAQRVMRSYERHFGADSAEIAFLRVLSLFDRPVGRAEIEVVLAEFPALTALDKRHWAKMLENLASARLIFPSPLGRGAGGEGNPPKHNTLPKNALTPTPLPGGEGLVFDTHPLIREHFAAALKNTPSTWCETNRRLYEFYKASAREYPDTFAEMQPLYAAVAHGCRAGLHQEALDEVFYSRIRRGNENYSWRKLGLFGSDLSALAGFFVRTWGELISDITDADKGYVIANVAFCLRAQGRLREALQPMRAAEDMRVAQENWKQAAIAAGNLSELQVTLGALSDAVASAQRSVDWANQSGDAFQRMGKRATLADTLHLRGERAAALALFAEAEAMQRERQPQYPLLYSLRGYRYCECLLAAWQEKINTKGTKGTKDTSVLVPSVPSVPLVLILERAEKTLAWAEQNNVDILSIALDHLALARALSLSAADGTAADSAAINAHFDQAVQGLRDTGQEIMLPHGLLHRAAWYQQQGQLKDAEQDLREALQIAERGEMRLFEADARLGLAVLEGLPVLEARAQWDKARAIIDETGYESRRARLEALQQQR